MHYLVVDGGMGGTGLRNRYEGGYVDPVTLGLSPELATQLRQWQARYEAAHIRGFTDAATVDALDAEGRALALTIRNALTEAKIEYCSAAHLTTQPIP